jgi:hypothetical protein
MIYRMTGGEVAPTTPRGIKTTTTPFGNVERRSDVSKLIIGAGGTYVARWTTYHIAALVATMKKALTRNGFAFLEVLSQCPVHYGRRIGISDPVEMLRWFQKQSVTIEKARGMSEQDLAGKFVVGEFVDIEAPATTRPGSALFVDADLVTSELGSFGGTIYRVPATKIAADEFKKTLGANMVMLGAVAAVTKIVRLESLKMSVREVGPKASRDLNMRALERGFEWALANLQKPRVRMPRPSLRLPAVRQLTKCG